MKCILKIFIVVFFALILTSCSDDKSNKSISTNGMTIEPYNMTKKENNLISKTSIDLINFFKLNGNLKDNEILTFSVDVYENGQFKEQLLTTSTEAGENIKMF